MYRARVQIRAADAFLWLEKAERILTIRQRIIRDGGVTSQKRGGKVNDDQHRNSDLLCISQLCDESFEKVRRALLEGAAIDHITTTHRMTEELQRWERFCEHMLQVVNVKPLQRLSGSPAR